MPHAIVLVDDERPILDLQEEALSDIGLRAEPFSDPIAAWSRIQEGNVSLVVTDWNMPSMTGMDLLFKTRALPHPPYVIMVTAHGTISRAVQAMNQGAFSFLEKPFQIDRYQELVQEALKRFQQSTTSTIEPPRTSRRKATWNPADPIVHSTAMQQALDTAKAAAATDSTILLLGESGSGKEVVADYIHRNSCRATGPFIKVNCGALPEHLMESELFGHEKGAFTGAERRNIGRFEQSSGGTLFLDEIGDLLLPLQVKLLRALQERTIERIGSSSPIPVDFRLVCATHRDLKAAVADKGFREDLFYRINVVPIRIPTLRERREDIVPLAQHFFTLVRAKLTKGPERLSTDALNVLSSYSWPGNVRQVHNAIEYAVVLCKGQEITPSDLPEDVRVNTTPSRAIIAPQSEPAREQIPNIESESKTINSSGTRGLKQSVQEAEAEVIRSALMRHHWRITAVARELKISRSTLYTRMELFGIKRAD